MAKKRKSSPNFEDFERIAEGIINLDAFNKIENYESFEEAYNDYMEDTPLDGRDDVKNNVFDILLKSHPNQIYDNRVIRAKGERLKERKGKLPRLTKIEKEKAIISGIAVKGKKEYSFVGREKGKVVYAYEDKLVRRKREIIVYRSKDGRFTGVRKE